MELSDENLNPIVTYRPLGGYSFYSVDSHKDNLVIASGTAPNLHLAILDKRTGSYKAEKNLSLLGFSVSQVFAFEKFIIVYEGGNSVNSDYINKIICYDLNLNQLWIKQALMAQDSQGAQCLSNADQSKFFYTTAFLNSAKEVAFKIICIDSGTGRDLWNYDVLDYVESNKNLSGYKHLGFYVTGFDYVPQKKSLVVVASSLFKSNESPLKNEYKNWKLIIINGLGKAEESVASGSGRPFLLKKDNKIAVVGKEKTNSYE